MPDQVTFPYTRCKFGVAVRDITPPAGIYHTAWGAASHDRSEGIHRPLYAQAAAFAPINGGKPFVLVAFDMGWFQNPDDGDKIFNAIQQAAGLEKENLLINFSHTHATTNSNSYLTDRPGGEYIVEYLAHLGKQMVDATLEALANMTPAWISYGYGRCALAINRDYWDEKAGQYACGYNPDGTPDDTMLVGRAVADDGRTLATLVNYSCHPTTLAWENKLLSPDFVGATREIMETAFGAPAIFLQGAQGETAPKEQYTGDVSVADRNGRILGYAACAAIEALPPPASKFVYTGIVKSGADLGTWKYKPATAEELQGSDVLESKMIVIDVRRKELPSAEDIEPLYLAETDRRQKEILLRRMLFQKSMGRDADHHMPLWFWRLGHLAVVAVPDELYSRYQQDVRSVMGDTPVLVLGVTNGTYGYMPPKEFYGDGRYQVNQSPYAPGCLEQVTEVSQKEVAALFPA